MNVAEYRDEVSTLSDLITAFQSCGGFAERQDAAERLERDWRRIALFVEQPKRLSQADKDRCQRILARASALLNDWAVEVASGVAEAPRDNTPPAKAVADTMRHLNAMKARGHHV